MSYGIPAGITTAMAAAAIAAYVLGWCGLAIAPWPVALLGLGAGLWTGRSVRASAGGEAPPLWTWVGLVASIFALLVLPAWPELLPRGGASDLTHHLMLVDVIERTRQLVDGTATEAALGEMAHYTPGLHLLLVIAGSLAGVEAYRAAYPVLALTIALKGGFVFLLAHDALEGRRSRVPLAVAAVGLVLFAPRAYSLDGFLQAGFYPQVASELFVLAGWWGIARWWRSPHAGWMAFAGLMGAAIFLVWPIWIGALMLTAAAAVASRREVSRWARVRALACAIGPFLIVATLHLSEHAAWLRMAGVSGAVPRFSPDWLGWLLIACAIAGITTVLPPTSARVTMFLSGAIALQALALWLVASARGATVPYMAMKMIYLAVYPCAVLAALGIAAFIDRLPLSALPTAWAAAVLVMLTGLRAASAAPAPAPLVATDLDAAARWARTHLDPACVEYIVDNAEQAYWLHLAVMGQPRSTPRTADLDGYTTNRAIGRWLEGAALPYAVARRELLPGEVLAESDTLASFDGAVVIRRRDRADSATAAAPGCGLRN